MIEAAFFTITPGKEQEITERYFSQVSPIAQEYGMRRLGMFEVTAIEHGPDNARGWGFFEWPNLEAKERFDRDPRFAKLRPIRDSLVDSLRMIYLSVAETTTIKLTEDRMFEFFGAWVNRTHGDALNQYFAVAGPWLASRGTAFPVQFEIVGSPDGYHFLPDRVGFVDWPDKSVKEAWFASEEFKSVGYHRAQAIDRLYVVESRAVFDR